MVNSEVGLFVYGLIRTLNAAGKITYFLLEENNFWSFPFTRFAPNEDLNQALARLLKEKLDLDPGSYFIEAELEVLRVAPTTRALSEYSYFYPVDLSFTKEAMKQLESMTGQSSQGNRFIWLTLDQITETAVEPNTLRIVYELQGLSIQPENTVTAPPDQKAKQLEETRQARFYQLLTKAHQEPSMEALASRWAGEQTGGVRVVRGEVIREILNAGSRAFNLRVADPYLPYQKQGLGFTWSFFTHKDKQDVHVHGLPAVEIYGILKGALMLWYKPMNQRGANSWRNVILGAGDWIEVEPLHCHFAGWVKEEGLGVVIKAAGTGELAGTGRLGEKGKTICQDDCNVKDQCCKHPAMMELEKEYQKPVQERDWGKIEDLVKECQS